MNASVNVVAAVKVNKGIPRAVEAVIALVGLVALGPLILLAAAAVALTSAGPIIFRQRRVGQGGDSFILYKLRTMGDSLGGPQVTSRDDQRVTPVGRILRKTKLDELPELWNVLKGDMSLVGPRPEVPRYVDLSNPNWAVALVAKPGITDPVTLCLRNEEELLDRVKGDRERFYLDVLQPLKLKGYVDYLQQRNWWRDVKVLCRSALVIVIPSRARSLTVQEVVTQGLR